MNKDQLKKWKLLAEKELKDKSIDSLNWETPEDINIKPLYTENDLKNLAANFFAVLWIRRLPN